MGSVNGYIRTSVGSVLSESLPDTALRVECGSADLLAVDHSQVMRCVPWLRTEFHCR